METRSHIKEMIRTHFFIVATNQQLQVVGFASITQQGYLHSMFVQRMDGLLNLLLM